MAVATSPTRSSTSPPSSSPSSSSPTSSSPPSSNPPSSALPYYNVASQWGLSSVTPLPASVDVLILVLLSAFFILLISFVRIITWLYPLHTRPAWQHEHIFNPPMTQAIPGYSSLSYGSLSTPTDPDYLLRSAAGPSYETLLEMTDRVGTVKHAFTDEQIDILPTYNYNSTNVPPLSRNQSYCAICREPFAHADIVCILPCSDEFHANCIAPWLRQQATCPLCRTRFE